MNNILLLPLVLGFLILGAYPAAGSPAAPQEDTTPSQPSSNPEDRHPSLAPWSGIGRNALAIFSGAKALLPLYAIGGTVLIIGTGLDTRVHNFFVRNAFFENPLHFAVSLGNTFPALLGGGFLASGLIGGSSHLTSAGGAMLQASLLAFSYTTALKVLTGRPGPEHGILNDNQASKTFRFGFLRGGVFHGWTSGHMMANTAAVTSLDFHGRGFA